MRINWLHSAWRKFWLLLLTSLVLASCTNTAPVLDPETDDGSASRISAARGNLRNTDPGTGGGRSSANVKLRVVRVLPAPPETDNGNRQVLSPGDRLEITFFNIEKLNREVQIDAAGNISMPLVGTVRAAGLSARELERDLMRLYGTRYLQNPQIAVNTKESAGQRVTINGEVKLPGVYPITPGTTLMRALALGRGFTPIADPRKVFIYRKIGGIQYVAQYDVTAIQAGRRADPKVFGGDIIAVFPSSMKVAMENLKSMLGLATQAGRLAVMPIP